MAKEFVITVVELESNTARAITVKTELVATLVKAFQITVMEFGAQLGMKPLQSEDVKGASAGEVKR